MESNSIWTFRNSYFLCLMSVGYVIGEIAHFLILTTNRAVARDVHYGDKECFTNATHTQTSNLNRSNNVTCTSLKNESLCTAVSLITIDITIMFVHKISLYHFYVNAAMVLFYFKGVTKL